MRKFVTILGYIIIGIVLLPIIAIGLYLIVGASLFTVLYILNRRKNGKMDPKDGKNYKLVSTILVIIMSFIVFLGFKITPLSWVGYFSIQGIAFVGLLPMCFYLYKELKNN